MPGHLPLVFDEAGERVAAAKVAPKTRVTRDLAETILVVCCQSGLLGRKIIRMGVALLYLGLIECLYCCREVLSIKLSHRETTG